MLRRWRLRWATCTSGGSFTGAFRYLCSSEESLTDQSASTSDIKPDNILLDEKGHAHLTDFNIAVHFTERRALTSVAGSMAYMGASRRLLLFEAAV